MKYLEEDLGQKDFLLEKSQESARTVQATSASRTALESTTQQLGTLTQVDAN